MVMVVLGRETQAELIRDRRERGADRHDEVWNGVYIMSPDADNEHQTIGLRFSVACLSATDRVVGAQVFHGCNVTDQPDDWTKNYRCPDVAVFLPGNSAVDMRTRWLGGPDFAVEVISPGDRSRKKFGFYAKVGVRELLLIGRKPWSLELYRLTDGELKLAGKVLADPSPSLKSDVLPVSFRLLPGEPRPSIEATQAEDGRQWLI